MGFDLFKKKSRLTPEERADIRKKEISTFETRKREEEKVNIARSEKNKLERGDNIKKAFSTGFSKIGSSIVQASRNTRRKVKPKRGRKRSSRRSNSDFDFFG